MTRSSVTSGRRGCGVVLLACVFCFMAAAAPPVQGQDVENGRSLVIVFDTTWSMDDDLQELRQGAAYIVKEMMRRETKPIHNYVFVPFNDPCESRLVSRLSISPRGYQRELITGRSEFPVFALLCKQMSTFGKLFFLKCDRRSAPLNLRVKAR